MNVCFYNLLVCKCGINRHFFTRTHQDSPIGQSVYLGFIIWLKCHSSNQKELHLLQDICMSKCPWARLSEPKVQPEHACTVNECVWLVFLIMWPCELVCHHILNVSDCRLVTLPVLHWMLCLFITVSIKSGFVVRVWWKCSNIWNVKNVFEDFLSPAAVVLVPAGAASDSQQICVCGCMFTPSARHTLWYILFTIQEVDEEPDPGRRPLPGSTPLMKTGGKAWKTPSTPPLLFLLTSVFLVMLKPSLNCELSLAVLSVGQAAVLSNSSACPACRIDASSKPTWAPAGPALPSENCDDECCSKGIKRHVTLLLSELMSA